MAHTATEQLESVSECNNSYRDIVSSLWKRMQILPSKSQLSGPMFPRITLVRPLSFDFFAEPNFVYSRETFLSNAIEVAISEPMYACVIIWSDSSVIATYNFQFVTINLWCLVLINYSLMCNAMFYKLYKFKSLKKSITTFFDQCGHHQVLFFCEETADFCCYLC
jgi:hypothetical protein